MIAIDVPRFVQMNDYIWFCISLHNFQDHVQMQPMNQDIIWMAGLAQGAKEKGSFGPFKSIK